MNTRHVVLGLAHPRSRWPHELAGWATSGAVPVEFLSCVTADEVRAVLGAGRHASAVLLDGESTQLDRDLIGAVHDAGAVAIAVDSRRRNIDWDALGSDLIISDDFDAAALAEVLRRHCPGTPPEPSVSRQQLGPSRPPGHTIAVTGTGGTGASTVAMALAQGLAATRNTTPDTGPRVVLVDGARRADLAMYHDVGDVLPGFPELLEQVRRGSADPANIRSSVFAIDSRGYDLLLGMRRSGDWAAHRNRSVAAALETMAMTYQTVVIDHDIDVDSDASTGSLDIEDRNAVALWSVANADAIVVVIATGTKGLHDAVRTTHELIAAGGEAQRIQIVSNRSPRSPAVRSNMTAAFARLGVEAASMAPPVFLPEVRRLEGVHRDGAPLPASLVQRPTSAIGRMLARQGPRPPAAPVATPLRTGQLGTRLGVGSRP